MTYGDVALEGLPHWSREQYLELFRSSYDKTVLELVTCAAICICIWEHGLLFGAELRSWKLLFQRRKLLARLAVIIARYAVICAIGVTTLFFFGRPSNCYAVFSAIYALYIVLWGACSSIFLLRLQIIYDGNLKVMAFFVFLWLATMAVWIVVITVGYKHSVVQLPVELQFPYSSTCEVGPKPRWASMGWGVAFFYDSCMLIAVWLAIKKFKKVSHRHSPRTRQWIWQSNIVYFGVATVFNWSCFITELFVENRILSHVPAPLSFVLHVVVASRLTLASHGWANGGLLEEDWDFGAKNKGDPKATISRSMFGPEQSITFDVTIDERIEYNTRARQAINRPAATAGNTSYHRDTCRQGSYSQGDRIPLQTQSHPTSGQQDRRGYYAGQEVHSLDGLTDSPASHRKRFERHPLRRSMTVAPAPPSTGNSSLLRAESASIKSLIDSKSFSDDAESPAAGSMHKSKVCVLDQGSEGEMERLHDREQPLVLATRALSQSPTQLQPQRQSLQVQEQSSLPCPVPSTQLQKVKRISVPQVDCEGEEQEVNSTRHTQ